MGSGFGQIEVNMHARTNMDNIKFTTNFQLISSKVKKTHFLSLFPPLVGQIGLRSTWMLLHI